MSSLEDPLLEEPAEFLSRRLLHGALEIGGHRVAVAELVVVGADSLPEGLISHLAAQHVEHPAPLLVAVRAEEIVEPRDRWIDHGRVGPPLMKGQNALAVPGEPGLEPVTAVSELVEEVGEIGCESLAEPDVVPVGLGHRVAEPLVGDLVRHQVGALPPSSDRSLVVEDGARVLRPAVSRTRLHVGELLVGKGAHLGAEKLHHPRSGCEVEETGIPVLRVDPGFDRDPVENFDMVHRKTRRTDHHAVGGDRNRLGPVREAAASGQAALLDLASIGHDLVPVGRGDDELARGLVVGMVDRWEPVARPVGPVVSEKGAVAKLVVRDEKAVGWPARVRDRDAPCAAARRALCQVDLETVVHMVEGHRPVAGQDGRHGHPRPCALCPAHQIEDDFRDPVLEKLHDERGCCRNRIGLVGELEKEDVVLHIDRAVSRIVIGQRGCANESCTEKRVDQSIHCTIPSRFGRGRLVVRLGDDSDSLADRPWQRNRSTWTTRRGLLRRLQM